MPARSIRSAFFGLVLALSACSGGGEERTREPPLVRAAPVTAGRFVDRVEAVGTARANEQVTLSAPVTERLVRINFADGGWVSQGQVVAVLAQGQEAAQLSGAEARAREAEQQLARVQALRDRGFATNATLDTQLAAVNSARAEAANARASIGDRVITAPFGGVASLRTVSAGAIITAGTEIATISDISRIKLDFTVPETLLSSIAPGQAIEARAAAWPDQPFRGQIETIDPVIDPETRAVMVRAILPNPDRRLRPGMLLTVAIESRSRNALFVPELAIVAEGRQSFVYVLSEGNRVSRVAVRTGAISEGRVEILEGLTRGQRVITEGVVKLSDDTEVRLAGTHNAQPPARGEGEAR